MGDHSEAAAEPVPPHLWNPNAASNWSLLFTPAFGAFLHAANWRELGQPARARANRIWAWATVVCLLANTGSLFVPRDEAFGAMMRLVGLGLLLGWYFTQGRRQARYVRESLGNNYIRKGWGKPLVIVVAALVAYVGLFFLVAWAVYEPDPVEVAAEVKKLILRDWQQRPEMRNATIEKLTLGHKGGKQYSGTVEATIQGRPQQLALQVTVDRGVPYWELRPLNDGPDLGTLLEFNQGELFYTAAVSREEAQRLGDYLLREGYFDGERKTVQLNRSGRTYEVRLVIKKGIEQDPEVITTMKRFAADMSRRVFASAPLDIHLCDDQMQTVRVVLPLR